jgi:hypothetical protein
MQKWYLLKLLQELVEGKIKENSRGCEFIYDVYIVRSCTPPSKTIKGEKKKTYP